MDHGHKVLTNGALNPIFQNICRGVWGHLDLDKKVSVTPPWYKKFSLRGLVVIVWSTVA